MKNDLTKEHKINLENIVNLKKKNSEIPKTKIKPVKPYYTLTDHSDRTLLFESRFESGNLLAAFKMNENSYQLLMQNDSNTKGYSQWFFFRVSNTKSGMNVKLNMINLMKQYSLYNKGLKILIYSEKKAEKEKIGWHRGGLNISYNRNSLYKFVKDGKRFLSSLIFNYEFEYDNDTVYFAATLPYLYTETMRELNDIQKEEKKYDFFIRKALCTTLSGNNLDYFTITSMEPDSLYNYDSRKGIVLMARVHPGETVSSWMMKGFIDFIIGESEEAYYLRRNFVFKIIPMMNPDGVICGNYRTSLAGCDLNRRWSNPNEILHPEIFHAKQMILKFTTQRKLTVIADFHGHSAAHNVFIYGNNLPNEPLTCKLFPYILSKMSRSFKFSQCAFKMPKSKLGTARINLFNELNIPNVFTIEASFAGCNKGYYQNLHFNSLILKEMGRDFGKTILTYHYTCEDYLIHLKNDLILQTSPNKKEEEVKNMSTSTKNFVIFDKNKLINEINEEIEKNEKIKKENLTENNQNLDESNGGSIVDSESEPSIDNLEQEQLMKLLPTQLKKKSNKYIIILIF